MMSLIYRSYVRIDKKKRYIENDWRVKHAVPLGQWEQRQRMDPESGPAHRHNHYKEYLRWFHSVTRVSMKPPRSTESIEDHADTDDDDDIIDEYDDITRGGVQPKRGPLQNYMVHNAISMFWVLTNIFTVSIMLGLTQSYQAQQLGRLANEASMVMAHASEGDNGGGHFRAFVEVTVFLFTHIVTIFVILSYVYCLTFIG